MARELRRGDLWLYEFAKPDKRRPVLILSRPAAIEVLDTVLVAPITSTVHGVASEVAVGESHGLKRASAVNLDHVQTVYKSRLHQYVGHADEGTMHRVCAALAAATAC